MKRPSLVWIAIAGCIQLLFSEVLGTDCYSIGERCAGAPGHDAIEWRCCENGGICDDRRSNDWGVFCRAADSSSEAAFSDVIGQCAASGEKCAGAAGYDYVTPKGCCSSTDECREAPDLGWGHFCRPRMLKSQPSGSDGILFPQSYPSITEEFEFGVDLSKWYFSNGYSNGQPFNNGWSNENYRIEAGALLLDLKKQSFPSLNGNPSYAYTGAEIGSSGFYGVGCYSVCMRPSNISGVSSSFYIHGGEYDIPPGFETNGPVVTNEIDVEFVGKDTTRVQTNFFRRVKDPHANSGSGHEQFIDLGFDASKDFHAYAIHWTAEGAAWYVDGVKVRTVLSRDEPFPDPSYSTLRIRANVWAVNKQAEEWAGPLDQEMELTSAAYKWMKFAEGSECKVEYSC